MATVTPLCSDWFLALLRLMIETACELHFTIFFILDLKACLNFFYNLFYVSPSFLFSFLN